MTKKIKLLSVALLIASGFVHADEHHPHPKFAKDVDAFHAVLAPLWHARPGSERSQNTCAKVGEMSKLAADIRTTNSTQLVESLATLSGVCQSNPAGVDGAFHDVHEAFHRLIDMKRSKRNP